MINIERQCTLPLDGCNCKQQLIFWQTFLGEVMWDEFDPIDPGEPLVPKHEPIEITPGRPPDSKPLELKPSAPRKFDADAPEIKEPDLMSEGSDGIKPPTGNKWSDWQKRDGKFPSVDEISWYMSFRNQNFKYSDGEKWGIWISIKGYEIYAQVLKSHNKDWVWRECCEAAWEFIKTHQSNHFLVDRAVATLEAAIEVNGRRSQYLWAKFRKLHQSSYSALEESSACAYSLRNAKASHLKHFHVLLEHQPHGYRQCSRDGKSILSNPKMSHQQAVSRLLSLFLDPKTRYRALGLHGLMLYKDHLKGTGGDIFFTIDGHKSEIEIHDAY